MKTIKIKAHTKEALEELKKVLISLDIEWEETETDEIEPIDGLVGLWDDNDLTIEKLREMAWKIKESIKPEDPN